MITGPSPPHRRTHRSTAGTAGALFAALARHTPTFSVFTGHLRRIAADLTAHGPTHRIAALERFCAEWLTARAQQLGQLLADAGEDGGRALLAMVTSGPWRGFDPATWDVLVAPWLARAEVAHTARPFLTAALHSMDAPPSRLVEAAVDWLVRRGGQTDTEHLLLALLEHTDLSSRTRDLVVEAALDWVCARPSWRHTPVLWKLLLGMDHPEERWERVAAGGSAWLSPYRSLKVASLVRAFLQRPGVEPAARSAFVQRVLGWLRAEGRREANIGPTLGVLLELDDVPGADRAPLVRWALDWLDESWTHSSRGRVLRALLASDDCPPALRPRLLAMARQWVEETPAESSTLARVLHALLTDEGAPEAAGSLLARLDADPDGPSTPAVLLRLLVNRDRLDGRQVHAAVAHALAWLGDHPEHESFGALLAGVLRHPALDASRRDRAADCALRWLDVHGSLRKAHRVLRELLALPDLAPSRREPAERLAAAWHVRHGDPF